MMPRPIDDVFPSHKHRCLPYVYRGPASDRHAHDFHAMNPSIHFDGERWYCLVRCVNYRLGRQVPDIAESRMVMLELDYDLDIRRSVEVADEAARPRHRYCIRGYEDARLFTWRGLLWATATCCDFTPNGNREMCLLEFGDPITDRGGYTINRVYPLRGPWSAHFQKNWIPCVSYGSVRLIYSLDRALVIDATNPLWIDWPHDPSQPSRMWAGIGHHRGSSQGHHMPDGSWLVIAHNEGYASRFMYLSSAFQPVAATPWFKFSGLGNVSQIEFCAGMAVDDDRLVASLSIEDASVCLAELSLAEVLAKMQPLKEGELWTPTS